MRKWAFQTVSRPSRPYPSFFLLALLFPFPSEAEGSDVEILGLTVWACSSQGGHSSRPWNSVWVSRPMMPHTHTHMSRGLERFNSHMRRLSGGEQGRLPNLAAQGLERAGKADWPGFYCGKRWGWSEGRGLLGCILAGAMEGPPGLPVSLLGPGAEKEERGREGGR